MKLHFLGGADTVTGSMHMIEVGASRILRDAGMYQGRRKESRKINETLNFDIGSVDAVLLSHAHIDHCGNLPTLCVHGYENPIHSTTATAKITEIMLRDSAYIQMQDAAYLNQKKSRKDYAPVEPLYDVGDAEAAINLFQGHAYHQELELVPGINMTAYEAGHILGAAVTHFSLQENGTSAKVGFAVDLGRYNLPLIRDPENMPPVDVLVMESTYGNRLHGEAKDAPGQLMEVINKTWARGGKVIIPAFALERAQELIYHISELMIQGKIEKRPVYLDSPMATAVTKVFDQNTDYLDDEYHALKEEMGCLMCPPWMHATASVDQSKAVTASKEPCVVIAASGMCEHGRILHHLKHGVEDKNNSIVIVGYQAAYTLGRRLVEQQKEVRIFGDTFTRRAEVYDLDAFSAHADRNDLIAFGKASGAKKIYLVHGEQDGREALAEALREETSAEVFLPSRGDTADI